MTPDVHARPVGELEAAPSAAARDAGVIVLGLDAGFSHFGWSAVRLVPAGGERVEGLGSIHTEPSQRRGLVRDDDQRRAAQIARQLLEIARRYEPVVLCAEALSHVNPKTSRMPISTTVKVGRAWGEVDMLAELLETALVQASPQAIKKTLCGTRSASKAQVKRAVLARYPEVAHLLAAIPAGRHEHPVDAVGAVVASLHTNELRLARRLGHEGRRG